MKIILCIYDHSVMMHVKFHEDFIGCREVFALLIEFGPMHRNIH